MAEKVGAKKIWGGK